MTNEITPTKLRTFYVTLDAMEHLPADYSDARVQAFVDAGHEKPVALRMACDEWHKDFRIAAYDSPEILYCIEQQYRFDVWFDQGSVPTFLLTMRHEREADAFAEHFLVMNLHSIAA